MLSQHLDCCALPGAGEVEPGLVPQTVAELFAQIAAASQVPPAPLDASDGASQPQAASSRMFTVKLSMMEIYNEVRDLQIVVDATWRVCSA